MPPQQLFLPLRVLLSRYQNQSLEFQLQYSIEKFFDCLVTPSHENRAGVQVGTNLFNVGKIKLRIERKAGTGFRRTPQTYHESYCDRYHERVPIPRPRIVGVRQAHINLSHSWCGVNPVRREVRWLTLGWLTLGKGRLVTCRSGVMQFTLF